MFSPVNRNPQWRGDISGLFPVLEPISHVPDCWSLFFYVGVAESERSSTASSGHVHVEHPPIRCSGPVLCQIHPNGTVPEGVAHRL